MSIQRTQHDESALVPVIRVPIEMPFMDTHNTHSWQGGLGAQAEFVPFHLYPQAVKSENFGKQATKMRKLIADIALKCQQEFYFQEQEFESKLLSLHKMYGEYRDAMSKSSKAAPPVFVPVQQQQQNYAYASPTQVLHVFIPEKYRGVSATPTKERRVYESGTKVPGYVETQTTVPAKLSHQ